MIFFSSLTAGSKGGVLFHGVSLSRVFFFFFGGRKMYLVGLLVTYTQTQAGAVDEATCWIVLNRFVVSHDGETFLSWKNVGYIVWEVCNLIIEWNQQCRLASSFVSPEKRGQEEKKHCLFFSLVVLVTLFFPHGSRRWKICVAPVLGPFFSCNNLFHDPVRLIDVPTWARFQRRRTKRKWEEAPWRIFFLWRKTSRGGETWKMFHTKKRFFFWKERRESQHCIMFDSV